MPPPRNLSALRNAAPAVLPSMLLCDYGNLQREVALLEEAGVQAFHLDVMDGSFVPNFTYGMPIVEAFRRLTNLPLDVHLMIANPRKYVKQFRAAGADIITFHHEAAENSRDLLITIRELGAAAGIAVNPGTPLSAIEDCLDVCDLVLVMSVDAGFGGQEFQTAALEKLRQLRDRVGPAVLLEVDGGVNDATIASCAEAGAQLFVVGSAIFRNDEYQSAISQLANSAKIAQRN